MGKRLMILGLCGLFIAVAGCKFEKAEQSAEPAAEPAAEAQAQPAAAAPAEAAPRE